MNGRTLSLAILGAGLAAGLLAVLTPDSSAIPSSPRSNLETVSASPELPSAGSASAPESPRGKLRIVVQAGGKGVAGASVTLLHEETHKQMDFATRADGTETVLALPDGEYHLSVCHPGYVFASVHRRLERGGSEEVIVHLQQGGRLEGRVVDGAGRALAGARVLLLEPRVGAPIAHDLCATTDSSGSYRIGGIPEGLFDVQFRHDRHRSWIHPALAVTGPGQEFQVNAVLDEGRRLAGRVVNEAGEPVPGATVVGSNGENATGRCGDEGRFLLEGLGEAPVHCFASAPGYGIAFLRNVRPGSSDLEFRLPRTATVSGQIDAGAMPERFNVQLSRFDPDAGGYVPLYGRAFDGAGGPEFQVPEVSPGRYRLDIQADGYEAQDVPELNVRSGHPLSGVLVRLRKKS